MNMRQTEFFTKTLKEAPKDEKSINAKLLIRAGFIDKLSAGVYTYLPLGLRVHNKIENIIRKKMNAIGGQEVLMPVLHPKEIWEVSDRWKVKEMFKLKARGDKEYGLGWTHEEVLINLVKKMASSYKDFPFYVYQIQTKFRDEPRAKSGILRGKEFDMKDLYSFHTSEKDLDKYYVKVKESYFEILEKLGIRDETYLTLASGGTFSKFSHEFQTVTPAGEDIIYICQGCNLAINKEVKKDYPLCPHCQKKNFKEEKAIEVGNIFKLGTKYTKPFNFEFIDKNGKKKLVVMGCYGLGLSRLIGTIAEVYHDDKGLIWPDKVAPFQVHLIEIKGSAKVKATAEKIYNNLKKANWDVLYDDREDKRAGEKFADADLIGIPWRVVISEKTLEKDSIEIKRRSGKEPKIVKMNTLPQCLE